MRLVTCLLLAAAVAPATAAPAPFGTVLWYPRPATRWVEALPIGNGRLGAMVYGGAAAEQMQFNEATLWTGFPRSYEHQGAARALPRLRQLIAEGKQAEAEALAMTDFMSVPLRQERYQPFGDLRLAFAGHQAPADYLRTLDLDSGVVKVHYRVAGVTYERQVFASH